MRYSSSIGCAALAAAGLLLSGCAGGDRMKLGDPEKSAQRNWTPGIAFAEIEVDGTRFNYAVYVPTGYDPAKHWPCIVFLHGAGECGSDGMRQTQVGLGPELIRHPDRWPFVVLMPQKPSVLTEWEENEPMIFAELAAVKREFSIDPQRVILTGLSQGGHGTWLIGGRHPEMWSCLAPICGYGHASTIAGRVAHLPIWAFHGEADDVVPTDQSRQIVKAIERIQKERQDEVPAARLTLYPGVGHASWEPAYQTDELAAWMARWTRPDTTRERSLHEGPTAK